jgi:hypothetical protein
MLETHISAMRQAWVIKVALNSIVSPGFLVHPFGSVATGLDS